MEWRLTKVCDHIIWTGLLILAVAIPPLIGLQMEDVVELPKVTLFRMVTLTMTIAWLIKWAEKKKVHFSKNLKRFTSVVYWFRKPALNLPVLAFLLISIITTLISVNIRISLVGEYKFYFWGLFSITGYTLIYFLITNNFKASRTRLLLEGMLIGSLPVAIYGLCQRLGLEFLNWAGGPSRMRIWSTLGNPNFLGGYLIMIIPLGLSLLMSMPFQGIRRKFLYKSLLVILIGLLFSCLVYTLSRGAWLGLVVSLFVWSLLVGKESLKRNRKWLIFALTSCIIFPILFGHTWNIRSKVQVLGSGHGEAEAVVERAISMTNLEESSVLARIETWKSSLRMIRKRPLLGWGLDNFGTIFPQFITPQFVRSAGRDMLQAHAHNEFLQVGATMGILGLMAYAWLIITFFELLVRLIKNKKEDSRVLLVGILSSSVALMVYNQFHFSMVTTSIIFWLFMGMVRSLSKETEGEKCDIPSDTESNGSPYTSSQFQNNFLTFGMFAIIYVFLSFLILRPVIADIYAKRGRDYAGGKSWDKAISSLKKAVRFNPWVELYRVNLANAYKERAEVINSREEKEECIEEAIRQFKETIELFPLSPFAYRNLGLAYMWETQILGEARTELALSELGKALEIFPCFISALEDMGKVYFWRNDLDKTCFYLNKALEILPEDLAMRTTLGSVYFKLGNKEKALQEWKRVWEMNPDYPEIKKYLVIKKGDKNE